MLIYFIIILAIVSRFIPHIPNFAPITALAIFSAAYLPWKKSLAITFGARLISDLFLGFFAWPMMIAVYASHLIGVLFGLWIRKAKDVIPRNSLSANSNETVIPEAANSSAGGEGLSGIHTAGSQTRIEVTKKKWFRIIASSLGTSIIFFLVTNFAFLYSSYPHDLSGIIQSYVNGLPFLRGTLMGDMFYSVALFGGYALAKNFQFSIFNFLKGND